MTFFALSLNMLTYERESGLGVVIHCRFLPVSCVMALLADLTQLILVYIILFMAIDAF